MHEVTSRRRLRALTTPLLLAALAASPAAAAAQAAQVPQVTGPSSVPLTFVPAPPDAPVLAEPTEEIIVFVTGGGSINQVLQSTGLLLLDAIESKGIYLLVQPAAKRGDVAVAIKAVALNPNTLAVEVNRRVTPPENGCSLPLSVGAQQCTIGVVDGTPTPGEYLGQPALASIEAHAAQALSIGLPSIVAVIDTGIDPTHPVFAGRLAAGGFDFVTDRRGGVDVANGLDDDHDGAIDEGYGHGTHIAGTVLAVNPAARILSVRVLDSDGNGTAFDVAQGIFHAVDRGAQVVNLSLSMSEPSTAVSAALAYAEANGVRVFSSVGNTGSDQVLFPASYEPGAIVQVGFPFIPPNAPISGLTIYAVAAVDAHDVLAGFSAYGADVDLCAPGVDVYSAVPGGGYAWWSGTSMACAVASGAASLLLSSGGAPAPPSFWSPGTVLVTTADPIGQVNPGFEAQLGAGRLNALQAVLATKGQ